jgi:hypothetical protein
VARGRCGGAITSYFSLSTGYAASFLSQAEPECWWRGDLLTAKVPLSPTNPHHHHSSLSIIARKQNYCLCFSERI